MIASLKSLGSLSLVASLVACGRPAPAPVVPVEIPPPNPCPAGQRSAAIGNPAAPEADRTAILRAMASVDVADCGKKVKGASGCAQAQIEVEPSGNVSSASACETTLPDAVRACIEKRFKSLSVPAFRDRSIVARSKVCVGGAS